jgi:hypothetical protein
MGSNQTSRLTKAPKHIALEQHLKRLKILEPGFLGH